MTRDPILFTPGPLTTSSTIKQAMLRDLGSRDSRFLQITQSIRTQLLEIAGVSATEFTTVLMQGSGTFGVESVLSSVIPANGKVLILSNGAYGLRMGQIAQMHRIQHLSLDYLENQIPSVQEVQKVLESDFYITHVAMVHGETTSGIINPIEEMGALCKKFNKTYIVDAMSTFGAVPIDMNLCGIDYLISSPNKCLESVPGFSFVLARTSSFKKTEGWSRSLSLDLYAQWKGLENGGEFRFTPPIQVILACEQALQELADEGGISVRSSRYQKNHRLLVDGMSSLGFKTYLTPEQQGYIITSFHELTHPKFVYKEFYERLQLRGYVIYSGKVTEAKCFRIGNIGHLFLADVANLLSAVRDVLVDMQILSGGIR